MQTARTALPRRLALAAHHGVHVRGLHARQVGLDPESGMVLEDLSPALAAMVDELGAARTDTAELLTRAGERGADACEAAAVLSALVAAGLVDDAEHADRVARRRDVSVVVVRGDGPLALSVAAGVARGGVGAVHVRTSGVVDSPELALDGLDPSDVGRPRAEAAAALLRRVAPGVRTGSPGRTTPDLVVLTDAQALDTAAAATLVRDVVDHLAVTVLDGRGIVGPLVLPGRSTCLTCVDLVRTGLDPGWPALRTGLLRRAGTADPAVLSATGALGVAQALRALDGPTAAADPPPTLGATVEIDPARATATARHWSPHPGCRCGAARSVDTAGGAVDAPCGPAASRGTITG